MGSAAGVGFDDLNMRRIFLFSLGLVGYLGSGNGNFYDFTEKPEKIMVFNLRELNQSCFFLNNSSRITFGYIQKLRSCLKPEKLEGWEALRQGVVNEPP